MSELKAIRGGDIHDLVEFGDGSEIYHDETLYYLKNAVDEDLAEKDKELRHHKYKRCLGLAAVCFEKSYSTTLLKYDKKSDLFLNFYDWWGNRWLELAEKFKEAK